MQGENIEVKYQTTAADYRRILFWYQKTRLLIVAGVYVLVALIIGWFFTTAAGGRSGSEGIAPTTVFVLFLMLPVFIGASIYWQIWRQAKKVENISEPSSATFSEAGLRTETESANAESIWERFHRVYVTESDFVFFPQENVFYSIPKRFFQSETEIESVTGLVKEQLGAKAIIKTKRT